MKLKFLITALTFCFGFISCSDESFTKRGVDILDGISKDSELSTLTQAIEKSGLSKKLMGTQYTFFAPTNQAFTDAGINVNSTDAATLLAILRYHMIPTRTDGSRFDTEYGVFTGAIARSSPYVYATNWLGNLTYLGVQTLNLNVNANIYYTQAIEVVDNTAGTLNLQGFYVNGARLTSLDSFEGADGVVHKINRVLLPPSGSAAGAIESDSDLSLFNKLVKKASANANGIPSYALSVLDVLPANALATSRAGTLTVLAPTNDAMTAEGYTSSAIDALTIAECYTIARRHVIGARWFTSDLLNQLFRNNPAVTTAPLSSQSGFAITYNNTGGNVFFSSAGTTNSTIAKEDIVTTNGVIHKINAVLK
jgi:uncharacterized surface protein with fasciclin (FAS1) repeats